MLTFNVQIDTSQADKEDRNAALLIVEEDNRRIEAENEARAAEDPPLDPLPLWPAGNVPELLDSYRRIWSTVKCPTTHNSYRGQSTNVTNKARGEAFKDAPESVQDQVDALLEPYLPTPEGRSKKDKKDK